MQPPRCAHLLLLALLVLCLPFGHAEVNSPTPPSTTAAAAQANLSPPCARAPLLSLAMGLVAAFALRLR
ncbi:hypothetical protein AV530_004455 [Patagioenas fasciata monilis]|uniref:Uncharacterized protein n=1 Tax=Patagioenas fasciata monilis TaxID=372326 RepID=A0A1V4JCL0_PATFA|nr:hypothetical protein AV530_004455 [Patagioenas fasciata monilis]